MTNFAVVQIIDGLVINIIVADANDLPQDGCELISLDDKYANIGWHWDGQKFVDPNTVQMG